MIIDNLTEFFKAISDPTRQRIINLLLNCPSFHVNEISEILGMHQSKVSRHLTILRNAKWLVNIRRDRWVYYRINPDLDESLVELFKKLFSNYLQMDADLKIAANKM